MKKSDLFKLNWKDFGKGLLVAVLTAVVNFILPVFQSGSYQVDWKLLGTTALTALLAYLVKNFLTNSEDKVVTPEK